MRFRDRIGNVLRALGGAINGKVYDRLDAIEHHIEGIEPILAQLVPPELERYEMRIFRKFGSAGFSPAVIYDIGAADGAWSADMHSIFPQSTSHLFEPLANHLPAYRTSLDLILPRFPSFTLHPVAVGAVTGQIQMTVHPEGYGSSVFHGGDWDQRPRIDVDGWTLDDFVAQHALPQPDLIKIDAQASEVLILGNARRTLEHVSMVFAETWFDKAYGPNTPLMTEVTELLEASDFRLVEIGHKFYNSDHTLFGCDAFYLKRRLIPQYAARMPGGAW
jgi:FkbM family methyltransferase